MFKNEKTLEETPLDIGYSDHDMNAGYKPVGNKERSFRASMAKQSFSNNSPHLGAKVGVFGAMLTIVGTIIGGGIVGIPFATLKTGIWLVLVVHALNFVWGIYSVHLLLEAKNISGLASFSELGYY